MWVVVHRMMRIWIAWVWVVVLVVIGLRVFQFLSVVKYIKIKKFAATNIQALIMSDDRDSKVTAQAMRRGQQRAASNPATRWTCQPKRKLTPKAMPNAVPEIMYLQVDARTFGSEMDSACVNFKNSPMCLSAVDVARARQRKQQFMQDM